MTKVAVVQMVSSSNIKDNLSNLDVFFRKACDDGVKLLVLPENFALMGLLETDKLKVAETYGHGMIQDYLSKLTNKYKIWVIAGSLPIKHSEYKVKASSLVFDDKGVIVARYDKIHLFDVKVSDEESHRESFTIEPGSELVVVDTPVGKVGLSICYDLRFPELYRQLVLKGAEIFTIPAAFTAVTGVAHWEVLLRARALENLCYVLAPNQGGKHDNGRNTYGHSMIVDPWGKIHKELDEGFGLISEDIDLLRLRQLRKQFPCNDHHVLI